MDKEALKKKFIVSEDHSEDQMTLLAERIIKFGRITKDGNIILDDRNFSGEDLVKICLTIKFIGNYFDPNISKEVRPQDLVKTLNKRIESIGSLLSKISKEGFCNKSGYGKYVVYAYKIESFLDSISSLERNGTKKTQTRKKGSSLTKKPRKVQKLTGVGLDIQSLVEEGFFKTPKFMSDIDAELRKEMKFHDPKVIDMTVRKLFCLNRRILKRIPNTEGGKAKWKYVIR